MRWGIVVWFSLGSWAYGHVPAERIVPGPPGLSWSRASSQHDEPIRDWRWNPQHLIPGGAFVEQYFESLANRDYLSAGFSMVGWLSESALAAASAGLSSPVASTLRNLGKTTSQGAAKGAVIGEDMASAAGTTVWRNVPAGHGALCEAQLGIVKPFGTTVDQSFANRVLAHDAGFTQGTGLTSWTSDLGWAQARQARLGGVFLETKAPAGSVWFNRAAKGAESQVLIPGEINATLLKP